jgi:LPS-assembly lipoprotein
MWWSRLALVLALLGLAGGCGFRPLYGKAPGGQGTVAELAAVTVNPIPDRLGQMVRNHLRDQLAPRESQTRSRYRLAIVLVSNSEGLAIKRDEEITRSNLRLVARFVLRSSASGETLLEGQTRSVASFNLVRSDFANLIAKRDAESRVARETGDQIATRLAIFFDRRRAG